MHNPEYGQDNVAEDQCDNGPSDWNDQMGVYGYSQQEEADGDFGKHQGLESLDPFAVGILLELDELPCRQVELMSTETIMNLHDN